MTLYKWSQTAASDATADSTINWAEGQAPSTVNDSARAMMAATAKYRDDNNGTLVTGGTSTAYTLSSNQVFDTLAHLNGQTLTFTANATSSATSTLNVDSLGAKPIKNATGVALATGALVSGSVYSVSYNNNSGEFLILNQLAAAPLGANSVVTANITDANVTYGKIQNVAASRLLGNPTGSAAMPSEISLGSTLTFNGSVLNGVPAAGPMSGAQGLIVTNNASTPSSKIDVTADQTTMLASGLPIYASSISVTIDTSTTGVANGLDTGARGNSTWYNLFLISNATTVSGLASLSATAPTMPSGYTYFVRVGAMITDSSGNFMRTRQVGSQTQWSPQASGNTTIFPVILSSAAAITRWTATSITSFVPPTATEIAVNCYSDLAGGGVFFGMAANGNAPAVLSGGIYANSGTSSALFTPVRVVLESQNLYFAAGGGAINAYKVEAIGWKDKVNAN